MQGARSVEQSLTHLPSVVFRSSLASPPPAEDEFDQHESDHGDGEPDDGEDLTDERQIRRDAAEGESDHEMESPAERKARKKAEKARGKGSRVDLRGEDDTLHMSLDQIREQQEAQALKNKFEQKYAEAGAGYDYEDYDEAGANVRSRGAALPSIRDPSLFVIQCGKGVSAEDVCWKLMQQYYKRERDGVESLRYQIFSCFTTPAARDRVYIEADRETHVEAAIKALPYRGLLRYYRSSTTNYKVPLSEMVASLKFRSEERSVEVKQWVRMKRGPYKDDLAQVVRTADQGTIITVKLVPRIDFAYLDAKRDNDRLTRAQFKATGGSLASKRPAQKLFDHHEIDRNYTSPLRKDGGRVFGHYWEFMGAKFKSGFYYKDVKIDALQTTHVNPLADELDRFESKTFQSDDDEEAEDEDADEKKKIKREMDSEAADAAAAAAAGFGGGSRKAVVFSLNDRVQVIAGGMKDVTGRVISLKGELLTIRPDDPRLGSSFDEMASHVRKYFKIGDHIKIVSGILKGETGMITHVLQEEDELAVHLDSGLRSGGDPKVSAQDAIESQEISTGRESFGSYEMGDLVQLAGDQVGVIVHIHLSHMTVLSTLGSLLQPKLQEVRFKLNDRFARTFDKAHAPIELGDVVQCLSAPHRGKKATVKHIVKKTLFLFNREVSDNGGLFLSQAGQVVLMQGDTGAGMSGHMPGVAPRSPSHGSRSPGPAPRSPGGSQTAAATAARPGSFLRKDPIIMQEVRITGGQYKSMVGVCKAVDSHGQARVELRAIFRTITIPRNQITELERSNARAQEWPGGAGARNPMLGGATPLVGGATPRHPGFGGATPAHEGFGSQTPGYGGSRTPSHRTPSHADGGADVWAAQTPAHRQEDRVADEEDEQEEWRTGAAGDIGIAPTPVNPQTPGAVPRTPGANPNTPYNPTTPHGQLADTRRASACARSIELLCCATCAALCAHWLLRCLCSAVALLLPQTPTCRMLPALPTIPKRSPLLPPPPNRRTRRLRHPRFLACSRATGLSAAS